MPGMIAPLVHLSSRPDLEVTRMADGLLTINVQEATSRDFIVTSMRLEVAIVDAARKRLDQARCGGGGA